MLLICTPIFLLFDVVASMGLGVHCASPDFNHFHLNIILCCCGIVSNCCNNLSLLILHSFDNCNRGYNIGDLIRCFSGLVILKAWT